VQLFLFTFLLVLFLAFLLVLFAVESRIMSRSTTACAQRSMTTSRDMPSGKRLLRRGLDSATANINFDAADTDRTPKRTSPRGRGADIGRPPGREST